MPAPIPMRRRRAISAPPRIPASRHPHPPPSARAAYSYPPSPVRRPGFASPSSAVSMSTDGRSVEPADATAVPVGGLERYAASAGPGGEAVNWTGSTAVDARVGGTPLDAPPPPPAVSTAKVPSAAAAAVTQTFGASYTVYNNLGSALSDEGSPSMDLGGEAVTTSATTAAPNDVCQSSTPVLSDGVVVHLSTAAPEDAPAGGKPTALPAVNTFSADDVKVSPDDGVVVVKHSPSVVAAFGGSTPAVSDNFVALNVDSSVEPGGALPGGDEDITSCTMKLLPVADPASRGHALGDPVYKSIFSALAVDASDPLSVSRGHGRVQQLVTERHIGAPPYPLQRSPDHPSGSRGHGSVELVHPSMAGFSVQSPSMAGFSVQSSEDLPLLPLRRARRGRPNPDDLEGDNEAAHGEELERGRVRRQGWKRFWALAVLLLGCHAMLMGIGVALDGMIKDNEQTLEWVKAALWGVIMILYGLYKDLLDRRCRVTTRSSVFFATHIIGYSLFRGLEHTEMGHHGETFSLLIAHVASFLFEFFAAILINLCCDIPGDMGEADI